MDPELLKLRDRLAQLTGEDTPGTPETGSLAVDPFAERRLQGPSGTFESAVESERARPGLRGPTINNTPGEWQGANLQQALTGGEVVGGFAPVLGEALDIKEIIQGVRTADPGRVAVGGAALALPFVSAPMIRAWKNGGMSLGSEAGAAVNPFAKGAEEVDPFDPSRRFYHATAAEEDFTTFIPGGNDPTLSGRGVWFSADPSHTPASHNIQTSAEYAGGMEPVRTYDMVTDPETGKAYRAGTRIIPANLRRDPRLELEVDPLNRAAAMEEIGLDPDAAGDFPEYITDEQAEAVRRSGFTSIRRLPTGDMAEEIVMLNPEDIDFALTNPFAKGADEVADALPLDEASRMARAEDMGFTIDAYHGTARPDRIEDVGAFSPERATSGPSAFFTDDPSIASNYATNKLDTSRLDEGTSFDDWFKVTLDDGSEVGLNEAFSKLGPVERSRLRNNLGRVTPDWDADDFGLVMDEGPGGRGTWDMYLREQRRDPIKAAREIWLDGAVLHGDEGRFVDVLEAGGLPKGRVRFDDPHAQYPGVIPTKLRADNPIDVHEDEGALRDLIDRIRNKPDARNEEIVGDMWTKDRRSAHEWADALEADLEAGRNSYAWTSIPDPVSEELRNMGYDMIVDRGGKGGGVGHSVYVPLNPNQIRSRFAKFDPSKADSSDLLAGLAPFLAARSFMSNRDSNRDRP